MTWLRVRLIRRQQARYANLEGRWAALHLRWQEGKALSPLERQELGFLELRLRRYPGEDPGAFLPTRLGNVLRAAEDYSATRYGLDGVFWWPRLEPLLPETLLERLDAAFALLVALLNLATLSGLVTLLLLGNLVGWARGWLPAKAEMAPLLWGGGAVGFLLAAFIIYRAAVAQARAYGELIRVAYDTHRFRILDALHIPRPANPAEEHALWRRLTNWLYQQDLGTIRELAYAHGEEQRQSNEASPKA